MRRKYIVSLAVVLIMASALIVQSWKSLVSYYYSYDSLLDKISIPAEAAVIDNPVIADREKTDILDKMTNNMPGYSLLHSRSFLIKDIHTTRRNEIRAWLKKHNMNIADFSLLHNADRTNICNSELLKAGLGINRYLVFVEIYSSISYVDRVGKDTLQYPASRIVLALYKK